MSINLFLVVSQKSKPPLCKGRWREVNALNDWVDRYYRDRLTAADLADPQLLREGREALDVLSQLLNLGSVYPFQREGGGNG